jgi:uncharacterized membrane protein YdjX (TVP38/TMEM64 family)
MVMWMEKQLTELLLNNQDMALLISVTINVVISIFGVLPSVFLTAANLAVFGFWKGTLVSFFGEVLGAVAAFLLYRKGFRNVSGEKLKKYPQVQKLLELQGKRAFSLILSLRIMPLIPSGVVTFAAAISQVSFSIFAAASTIGKAPALLLEAYSVNEVTQWTTNGKIILFIFSLFLLIISVKRLK